MNCLKLCFSISLACAVTLAMSQNIGINESNPIHPVQIKEPTGTILGFYDPVLRVEYTGSNPEDVIAVQGISKPSDYYGIGGRFEGGFAGAYCTVYSIGNQLYYGVLSNATGIGNGKSYGVHSEAEGSGNINYGLCARGRDANVNYGVYADAFGGSTNWAGYFDGGNVFIKNRLGIGQDTPVYPLHVHQPSGTTLNSFQAVTWTEYTGTNNADVIGIRGKSRPQDFYGIGGSFEGGWVGVLAKTAPTGSNSYYGIRCEATGGSGTNYAVYGHATGTGTNWAGYFDNGNVYVKNRLGIGRTPATNSLEVEGIASKTSAGDWVANSDARLKKHIQPLDPDMMLTRLLSLQGITYEWDDQATGTSRPQGIQMGFTAQNIRDIFPELVTEDSFGYLQTAYGTYDPVVVEAIRALNNSIEVLKAENEELRAMVEGIVGGAQVDKTGGVTR